MELAVFEQLHEKVEQLIEQCIELKEENKKITETLYSKDKEIEGLHLRLEKFSKEKGLIREKVKTILERVEGLIQTA
ncbi:MAG: cell division protein ZapB [Deltaproteobacteria bacterium]|nr:cell division protein ZapB [Deltaproteobacteria bacterium]